MHSPVKAAIPIAVAVALISAAPAAEAKAPAARASGGDVVELTYPSIVRIPVRRAERALARATRKIENDKPAAAERPLAVVRRQVAKAWRGAKYKIRTTPPAPPADDARFRPQVRSSGDGPTGPTLASPADSAFRVLTLQHDVAAEVTQLLDDAPATAFDSLNTTLQLALDGRDAALQDIITLAPADPSDDDEDADEARVRARASGDGPVVSTFATVMPNVIPQLDDEADAIQETTSDSTDLTAEARAALDAAGTQIVKTKAVVSREWPPIPDED
jgi:hypothetical protein